MIDFVEPARAGRRTAFVTKRVLERTLVDVIREFRRREVAPLLERVAMLETADRFAKGLPVGNDEWRVFCERLADRTRHMATRTRKLAERWPMTTDDIIDDMVGAKLREGAEWIDAVVIDRMRELYLAAGDLVDHPRVAPILREQHDRMLRWRDSKLDELESRLLREVGRLH